MKFFVVVITIVASATMAKTAPIIAVGKSYVDSGLIQKASTETIGDIGTLSTTDKTNIVSAINEVNAKNGTQSDWSQTDTNSASFIKNKPTLAAVATTGDYNDLQNKPTANALRYEIRTNSIDNAATNDEFFVDMDGFRFRAYKISTANRWGVRLINNTGGAVTIGSTFLHLYGGAQNTNKESVNLANGAEFNPDTEANDLGYGKEDIAFAHIFDTTNMHLYRWTVSVYSNKSIMVVEKLY